MKLAIVSIAIAQLLLSRYFLRLGNAVLAMIIINVCSINYSLAQEIDQSATNNDSSAIKNIQDSSKVTQSINPEDTVLYEPLPFHGNMRESGYYIRTVKQDMGLDDYADIQEYLEWQLPAYPLFLGGFGLNNSLSIFGGNSTGIGVAFNGRNFGDLEYNTLNLSQIATEFFESIEVYIGSDAAILSDNGSTMLINVQEIKYNTRLPYTRLWFNQAGYGSLAADGVFSQNLMRNVNFTMGFRAHTSDNRYDNESINSWNVRGQLRISPDERTTISISEIFTNYGMGLSGGVDLQSSEDIYDEVAAQSLFGGSSDRTVRHDLSINATRFFDDDTTLIANASLYLSHTSWENWLDSKMMMTDSSQRKFGHLSRWFGANFKLDKIFASLFKISTGAEIRSVATEESVFNAGYEGIATSIFGRSELKISELLNISGGLRLFDNAGMTGLNFGAKGMIDLGKIKLTADLSRFERIPNLAEGLQLKKEGHNLINGELMYEDIGYILRFGVYFRNIENHIKINSSATEGVQLYKFENTGTTDMSGAYIMLNARVFDDFAINMILLNSDLPNDELPSLYGKLSIYYEMQVVNSILRLGIESSAMSEKRGYSYIPFYRAWDESESAIGNQFSGITAFARAKLGNAFVRISFENALGNNYYYVALHPMYEQVFRLSVAWSFFD